MYPYSSSLISLGITDLTHHNANCSKATIVLFSVNKRHWINITGSRKIGKSSIPMSKMASKWVNVPETSFLSNILFIVRGAKLILSQTHLFHYCINAAQQKPEMFNVLNNSKQYTNGHLALVWFKAVLEGENISITIIKRAYLDMHQCGCWGWTLGDMAEAEQGTSHTDGPMHVQWLHNKVSSCTQCQSAGLDTSGCWPEWNKGLFYNLEMEENILVLRTPSSGLYQNMYTERERIRTQLFSVLHASVTL